MELRIKFVQDDGKESGVCHIHKVIGSDLLRIGEIKYADESDRKWVLSTMLEDHPNVAVIS